METLILGNYLRNPSQIEIAISNLEKNCEIDMTFEERFSQFETDLQILNGDGLPITGVVLTGPIARARVHDERWVAAKNISEIGINLHSNQGRAHSKGYNIFYGANSLETAAYEVLQHKSTGEYEITIGQWVNPQPVRIVNFVDGADKAFSKIPFVHSRHKEYLTEWPEVEKKSAILLIDYFKNKFMEPSSSKLYNITNVLGGMCFSLQELDGIGYGSTSNNFLGFNIALREYKQLKCTIVQRYRIIKAKNTIIAYQKIMDGVIDETGKIRWPQPISHSAL